MSTDQIDAPPSPGYRRNMPDGSSPLAPTDLLAFTSAADRLFDALSRMIVSGEIGPGAKISEPDLAARFGTSRAPLREAMRRLQERKLITHIARQGARVAVLSPARIGEIYLVREVLEGVAARQAAQSMSAEGVAELASLLDVHEARVSSSNLYLQGTDDDDFHVRIIRASGNATLIALLLDEYYLLIRMLRVQQRVPGAPARRALAEHRRIADAIADRDVELAELLMRRHISAAHSRLTHDTSPALAHNKISAREKLP